MVEYVSESPYKMQTTDTPFMFKIHDLVRVSLKKKTFEKEHDQNWSEELFRVRVRSLRAGIPIYRIVDLLGERVSGAFYQPELQKVHREEKNTIWKVDKVLHRKRKGKKIMVYVSWVGYPKKFNSWIEEKELVDI